LLYLITLYYCSKLVHRQYDSLLSAESAESGRWLA